MWLLISIAVITGFCYSFHETIKNFVIRTGLRIAMNNMGLLDSESVEKYPKFLKINYSYLGSPHVAVVPLGVKEPRGRSLCINNGDRLITISGIRGCKYNFTADEIGVSEIMLIEKTLGRNSVLKVFTGNEPISML